MKNILGKCGFISRPALIGTVLGVATVAVGVGIVTNFAGGSAANKSVNGLSGSALQQYAAESAGTAEQQAAASGYSKEALEAGIAAAQRERDSQAAVSLKDAAGADKLAYSNTTPQLNQDNLQAGQGGSVDAMDAGAQGIAAGTGADAQQAAAERAAKVQAGMDAADTAQAQLATSKTMSGGFSRGGGSGSGGASYGGSYNLPRVADKRAGTASISQQAAANLPGVNVPNQNAFKSGRLGEIGGSNAKAQSGGAANGNGQAFFSTSVAELANASRYSQAGKKTVYGDSSKGAALAQAAFDGSETAAEGVKISGTNVQQAYGQALDQVGNNLKSAKYGNEGTGLNNVDADMQTYKDVRNQIWGKILQATIVTIGAIFAITAGVKAGGFWGWLAAGAAAVIALASIWATGVPKLLSQLHSLKYTGGMNATWTSVLAYTAMGVLTAAVGLAFVIGLKAKAAAKAAASKIAEGGTKEAAAAAAKEKGGAFVSKKAAGKMADKAISDAAAKAAGTVATNTGGNVIQNTLVNQATNAGSNMVSNVGSGGGSSYSGSSGSSSSSSGSHSSSGSSADANPYQKGTQDWQDWEATH